MNLHEELAAKDALITAQASRIADLERQLAEASAPAVEQQIKLDDIEQYRCQMAGISTAAIGYWKEGDSIHPDYDTIALRDVAKLYANYDALYKAAEVAPQAADTDKGREALAEVVGCFEAAEVEGLSIALAETADERLKDLIERRVMHALYAAQAVPIAAQAPVREVPQDFRDDLDLIRACVEGYPPSPARNTALATIRKVLAAAPAQQEGGNG